MQWSRELKIARRSVRTAMRAATAMARARIPLELQTATWPMSARPPASGSADAITDFGANPGHLAMFLHVPPRLAPGAGLIVLLHGCGQTALAFARDTGWTALSDRLGIPLLLPEQSDGNNGGRCFQWFRPTQVKRDLGEAASIRAMVSHAMTKFDADPARVFVAGLSAGGAMTAAMLAAYPDVFAAGAVVAGLPVGAASSATEALSRMADAGPPRSADEWATQVRRSAPVGFEGPWPRLSIWHGSADRVVDPANAKLLAEQWTALHGLDATRPVPAVLSIGRRVRWGTPEQPAVEAWSQPGVAHVWPPEATDAIAQFWGLSGEK